MSTEEEEIPEQPLIAHLIELRDRLLKSILSIAVVFLCIFYFSNDIYLWVSKPLRAYLPPGSSMIATDVASPFFTPFKLTMVVAVFLAMPFILYQFWRFVAPGLYKHEKKLAIPMLISSIVLFYCGVLFAYYVVFPIAFAFFTAAGPHGIALMPDITSYLNTVLKLFFAFGVAFEIPIAIVILVSIGVTSPEALKEKRPYIVVICFIVGMLLTPPDIFSQTLLAVPMWLLFELGVFFSKYVLGKNAQPDETEAEAND
jgi:sec-independent protein translocase protein TatC